MNGGWFFIQGTRTRGPEGLELGAQVQPVVCLCKSSHCGAGGGGDTAKTISHQDTSLSGLILFDPFLFAAFLFPPQEYPGMVYVLFVEVPFSLYGFWTHKRGTLFMYSHLGGDPGWFCLSLKSYFFRRLSFLASFLVLVMPMPPPSCIISPCGPHSGGCQATAWDMQGSVIMTQKVFSA